MQGGEEPRRGQVDRSQVKHVLKHELDTANLLAHLGENVTFVPTADVWLIGVSGRGDGELLCWAGVGGIGVDQRARRGMNFRRRKFVRLLDQVIAGEVSMIVVAHRDRLARFGFELIEWLAGKHGCAIVVANQQSLSPQQELVEDLLAIVGVFCCRLYGLRRYEKQLKAEGAALSVSGDTVRS